MLWLLHKHNNVLLKNLFEFLSALYVRLERIIFLAMIIVSKFKRYIFLFPAVVPQMKSLLYPIDCVATFGWEFDVLHDMWRNATKSFLWKDGTSS